MNYFTVYYGYGYFTVYYGYGPFKNTTVHTNKWPNVTENSSHVALKAAKQRWLHCQWWLIDMVWKITCVHLLSVYSDKISADLAGSNEFNNKIIELIEKEGLHPE